MFSFLNDVLFHFWFQEQTLALRKEGIGVVLDSELPHLIGIDDDLLSTGIILYHLKVKLPEWNILILFSHIPLHTSKVCYNTLCPWTQLLH